MHLTSTPAKLTKSALFSAAAALCAVAFAPATRAETRIGVDLGLRLGPPAPVIVREAPPRPIVERVSVSPGSGYVWIAGHNSWRHSRWVWVSGVWALPPQPGAFYVEGRWDAGSRNWVEAHWEIAPPPPPAYNVEFSVGSPPPPPRQEVIIARPSPYHVWIAGYWVRHGHRQEWMAGHWELPPRGRHEWVAPRWEHRGNGYVFIEGSWR